MKSLDIVNRNIESINNQLNDYDEDDEEYGFYPSYDTLMYELNELETIKKDLEVLNILKNKEIDIFLLNDALKSHKYDIEGALKFYNNEFIEEYQLTLDEIDIIDRWLRK